MEFTRTQIQNALHELGNQAESLADIISLKVEKRKTETHKQLRRKVRHKKSKELGFNPKEGQIKMIRELLNEKIIAEKKMRKLKHREIAGMIQSSRPNVTALLNRRLKKISTDYMLHVLEMMGFEISIEFKQIR